MSHKRTILVTGGAGFIGSNFVEYFLSQYPGYKIINLDKLTYAGSEDNLIKVKNHPNHVFIRGDITEAALINDLFGEYHITDVIHFAAESHVDNSIANPSVFIETNVMGTYQLLEAAKNHWNGSNQSNNNIKNKNRFFHISTDEVYGSLGSEGHFTEASPYQPNSPYSASKAASDHLVRSYFKTYGLNTCISNCSNNFGPHQHDEKLIPTIIRHLIQDKPVPIYGSGNNIRDWIYVEDHCKAIDKIFHEAEPGSHYNIGGDCELKNIEIVERLTNLLGKTFDIHKTIFFVSDRLGHDFRYAISNTKINQELKWFPSKNLDKHLASTIDFYINKYKKL